MRPPSLCWTGSTAAPRTGPPAAALVSMGLVPKGPQKSPAVHTSLLSSVSAVMYVIDYSTALRAQRTVTWLRKPSPRAWNSARECIMILLSNIK